MQNIVLIAAAAAAVLVGAAPATARGPVDDRQYSATYRHDRGVYCIRFFSDSMNDPRPNTAAPTCMTRARWAQQRVFIQHRRGANEIAAR